MSRSRAALLLLLASCASPPPAPPARPLGTLKIGALFPMGMASGQSEKIVFGIRMALTECGNSAGGFEIKLEVKDHELAAGTWNSQIRHREAVVDELCEDPEILAVIGPFNSGMAAMAIPRMKQAGVVLVSPTASWIGLTRGPPQAPINFARLSPPDDVQGEVAADWAKKSEIRSVYILDDGGADYGRAVAERFAVRSAARGLTIAGRRTVDPDSPDFTPLAKEIKSLRADLVYLGGTTQSMKLVAWALAVADPNLKLMAPDGCFEPEFIESVGSERLKGRCFVTSSWLPAEQLGCTWAPYGRAGRPWGIEVALGYEAGRVILDAIRRAAAKDREAIRAAVLATRNHEGVLGRWSFDANGDTTNRRMGIYEVRDGKFELIEVMN